MLLNNRWFQQRKNIIPNKQTATRRSRVSHSPGMSGITSDIRGMNKDWNRNPATGSIPKILVYLESRLHDKNRYRFFKYSHRWCQTEQGQLISKHVQQPSACRTKGEPAPEISTAAAQRGRVNRSPGASGI